MSRTGLCGPIAIRERRWSSDEDEKETSGEGERGIMGEEGHLVRGCKSLWRGDRGEWMGRGWGGDGRGDGREERRDGRWWMVGWATGVQSRAEMEGAVRRGVGGQGRQGRQGRAANSE